MAKVSLRQHNCFWRKRRLQTHSDFSSSSSPYMLLIPLASYQPSQTDDTSFLPPQIHMCISPHSISPFENQKPYKNVYLGSQRMEIVLPTHGSISKTWQSQARCKEWSRQGLRLSSRACLEFMQTGDEVVTHTCYNTQGPWKHTKWESQTQNTM